jgi:hypothetical protein
LDAKKRGPKRGPARAWRHPRPTSGSYGMLEAGEIDATLMRNAREQGLIDRLFRPEELFAPNTLTEFRI